MRFLRVTFRCFGPFEERELDFSKSSGLHVVFGQNEAGKSSALRGLYGLLFGFPQKSTDNFRFSHQQFRVAAALQNAAGDRLECVRRKGLKATLRQPDDKTEIAEAKLAEFLGGLQQPQFEQLFGLDCERLVNGGKEIAAGQGDLGEALFAAGAGLAGLRKLAASLESRREALYKPRSQSLPINVALLTHVDLQAALRANILPPDKHAEAVTAAAQATSTAQKLRENRNQIRAQLAELARYHSALPTIALLEHAQQRLARVADAPRLPADFEKQLTAARKELELARAKAHDQSERRKGLTDLQQASAPPAAILAEEAELDLLSPLVGADRKTRDTAIKADTRRREVEAEARDIFRELTGSTEWDEMSSLKPRREDENCIQDLAARHQAVKQAASAAEERLQEIRAQLADAERRLSQLGSSQASIPWLSLVETLTARGPLEDLAGKLKVEVTSQEKQLQAAFGRFQPPVSGEWEQKISLPVPSCEAIAEFRHEFQQVQQVIARYQSDLAQIDRERAAGQLEMAAATGAEPAPTSEELVATRAQRDGGLQLVRRRLDEQADLSGESNFIASVAPDRTLIDATEVTVRQADTVADRLRREADRVATAQAQQQRLATLQDRRQEISAQLAVAQNKLELVEQQWRNTWTASGIQPLSPEVMQGWLVRWEQFVSEVGAWKQKRAQLQDQFEQITAAQTALAVGCPATSATKTLSEGLNVARKLAKETEERNSKAEKLRDEVDRLGKEVGGAEEALRQARDREATWHEQWTAAISVLRLQRPDTSVSTAQFYLKRIDEMQQHLADARIKAAQVKEFALERAALLQRLTSLRQRLEPAAKLSTDESLDNDFRIVESALKLARVLRGQHEERAKQIAKLQSDIDVTNESIRSAEATLIALAKQSGVSDPAAIEPAVQRSRERAEAEKDVREYEQALAQVARGQVVAEFCAAALGNREGIDEQIERFESEVHDLDGKISAAEDQARTTNDILAGYEHASDAAAEARQQAELVATRLADHVVEYAALHVASVALERAKERYRARNQDSLLSRAGEYFRTLTGEAFGGLDIDNDEGEDVLKAVRDNGHPNQRVAVGGLSDGTRDQLFLALRLAGIEQHLQNREPVPLIIDDVLMTFDDTRSRATLRCLAELSAKTQVLLFTHHRHVVDLATEVHSQTIVHQL